MKKDSLRDLPIILPEVFFRNIYWRNKFIRNIYEIINKSNQKIKYEYNQESIIDYLAKIGVSSGSLIMVHSSLSRVKSENLLQSANKILTNILSLIDTNGTLCMPTHPYYKNDPGFMFDKSDLICTYDPQKTISRVGIINEIFRRKKETKRSFHPLSSLSVIGPLSDFLLENNLNGTKPLPHGISSSYFKFYKKNGLVISIGIPLASTMTIFHCGDEIRDGEWPVDNFFYERKFKVVINSEATEYIVRERRPEFVRCLCTSKRRKDLLREGILHEASVNGIRVDWAQSKDVVDFMLEKNMNSSYPYYFPKLASIF